MCPATGGALYLGNSPGRDGAKGAGLERSGSLGQNGSLCVLPRDLENRVWEVGGRGEYQEDTGGVWSIF